MTHVKNVQAFGKLKEICTGYGGAYNPGQQNLQVEALITLLHNAQNILEAWREAETAYNVATNHREQLFDGIPAVASRVSSLLKASGASEGTVNDAWSLARKLRGVRKHRPAVAATEVAEKPQRSVGGRTYANMVHLLGKLVELVEAVPNYHTQEAALSVAGLQQLFTEAQQANMAVAQAEVALGQVRMKRNDLFYRQPHNLFSTARAVKEYVRGTFGFRSPQHTEVIKLRFIKPTLS